MTELDATAKGELDQERLKELASIARLISYARQCAESVGADFPVWCLDMALAAVLQEISPLADRCSLGIDCDEDADAPSQRH